MKINDKKDYNKTLNLQQPTILMDGNLVKREAYFLDKMQDSKKLKDIEEYNKKNNAKTYRLAELPIYIENRVDPTMVVNKVIKDIFIRRQYLKNNIVKHSLLFTNTRDIIDNEKSGDAVKIKNSAKKRFLDIITNQTIEINRLGTLFNYENYKDLTHTPDYENKILDKFFKLYSEGKLTRECRPVDWCVNCVTSYAKEEVNIKKARLDNYYIKFKVKDDKKIFEKYNNLGNIYLITSTTKIWSLNSCEYLAISKEMNYDLVEVVDNTKKYHYIISEDFTDQVMQAGFYLKFEIKETFNSKDIKDIICVNPLDDSRDVKILMTNTENIVFDKSANTGVNIVSNGNTYFDYIVLKENNIQKLFPIIDEKGEFTSKAILFQNENYIESSKKIIDKLKGNNYIFAENMADLLIPKCKICNEDIIYRPVNEWYLSKDETTNIDAQKKEILKSKIISNNKFIIKEFEKYIEKINDKKEVIVSNENVLGTPVPVFYCADCGRPVVTQKSIDILKGIFLSKGVDSWYNLTPDKILEGQVACVCGCWFFFKETVTFNNLFKLLCVDVFDVKADSTVFIEDKRSFYEQLMAISFLEESQKQLLNIENFFIHSTVFEKTKTIAKPLFFVKEDKEDVEQLIKKNIGVNDIIKKYGTDVLRLWVFSVSNDEQIKLNEQSIIEIDREYKSIRKTIKFILSNVTDFTPNKDNINLNNRTDLDKYMYVRLKEFQENINKYMSNYRYSLTYQEIRNFCANELCDKYFEVIKYGLYIQNKNDLERRSIQSTLYEILFVLIDILKPIIPFTIEEIWPFIWHRNSEESKNSSLFRYEMNSINDNFEKEQKRISNIFFIINNLNKYIKEAIEKKVITNSLQAKVIVVTNENTTNFIKNNYSDLIKYLKISSIDVKIGDGYAIKVVKEPGNECARCRRLSINIGMDLKYRYLCPECVKILEGSK